MTVTTHTVDQALSLLRATLGSGLRDATAAAWAAVLNAAPLTVTDRDGRHPVRDEHGIPVPLNPTDGEVLPAAMSMATLGAKFVQAADLACAIQNIRAGDRATRNARIQEDIQRHGLLLPEGLAADVGAELAWRRAATAAIGAGATREQAVAHAWRSVGRVPAAAIESAAPAGGLSPRAVLAALAERARVP